VSRASSVAAAIAALALLSAPPAAAELTAPAAPTRATAWIARVVVPTVARTRPDGGTVVSRVDTRARWNGGPVGLLVLGTRPDDRGRLWVRVALPRRPNGSSGWIRADLARLTPTDYRVEVSVGRRVVRLLHRGQVVRSYRAVVGASAWPTPLGLFAVSERVAQPNPWGFLGPWALHLTAFSPTLLDFGGGPGQVAIHGRAGASLADPLGTARSHGCIRIPNDGIRLLARVAREGTPVRVVP
jgi:lipoprotein-anchoring transpeptidase ErfK/SrfK